MKHHVCPPLVSFLTDLYHVQPDRANARIHPKANLDAIKLSLQQFGQDQLLVARKPQGDLSFSNPAVLIKGHGRYQVMHSLGWTHAAVLLVDDTTEAAVARSLADNRTAELARWDYDMLRTLVVSLPEPSRQRLGWNATEVSALLETLPKEHQAREADPVLVTPAQRETFDRAVGRLREMAGETLTEGRCLELLAADWLSGQ